MLQTRINRLLTLLIVLCIALLPLRLGIAGKPQMDHGTMQDIVMEHDCGQAQSVACPQCQQSAAAQAKMDCCDESCDGCTGVSLLPSGRLPLSGLPAQTFYELATILSSDHRPPVAQRPPPA